MGTMLRPIMTVFAGTNGAGKSTLTKQLVDRIGEVIDPDAIAKRINPENPESVSPTAGRETIKRVQECIKQGLSFSIETTLAGKNAIRQMEQAKAAGFEVNLYYVGLKNVEYHISRVEMRVAQGGHHIPEEDIRRRYDRSLSNLPIASGIAERSFVFDNTSEFTQLLEVDKGRVRYLVQNLPEWAERVFKGGRPTLSKKLEQIKPLMDKQKLKKDRKGNFER
ncbi:Zeta toxin [compost metagenome]